MRSIGLAILAALGWLGAGALPLAAQTFPDRSVKIVVPQPPGGGFDLVGRVVADRLQALLGQSVIVENKPGDRKSTRLNSNHPRLSRMPSSA